MAARLAVGRRILAEARSVRVTFLAAAVAYYAFVSLVPLLLLALSVGSLLGGETFAISVVNAIGGFLSPQGQELVRNALTETGGRSGVTILGLVLLTWSGMKVFRAIDTAFSQVYGVDVPESFLEQLGQVSLVLGSIGVSVITVVSLNGLLPRLGNIPFLDVVGVVLTFSILPLSFLPMYYTFPDVRMSLREAVPGAILAATGWVGLVIGFRIYAAIAGSGSIYGILGGVLLVIMFLYLAASIMILGAVTNAVLAGRTDDDETVEQPDLPDGVPDIQEMSRDLEVVRTRLEEKTVDRSDLEADLREYIRDRARRNHARGWGPYLVLLYGTAMTIGAFYYLSGGWAILAMLVVWLSTLGLYVVMLVVGMSLGAVALPRRVIDWLRSRKS
jgi:membrane protein